MSFGSLPSVLGNGGGVAISVIGGTGLFADGTAAAPSISFAADTDTGFYRHSGNVVGLSIGGVDQFRWGGTVMQGGAGLGGYISLPATGEVSLVAGGTAKNITLTPSGTGVVAVSSANWDLSSALFSVEVKSYASFASGRGGSIGFGGLYDGSNSTTFAGIAGQKESAVSGETGGMFTFHTRSNSGPMSERARLLSNGRFLLGTTTDSGALLQVGTNTTTAAGGMVFGTDTFLFRSTAGSLILNGPSQTSFSLSDAGTPKTRIEIFGSDSYLSALTGSLIFRTNGAFTALTLDSSQNAAFAGTVKPQLATTAGAPAYVKGAIYFDTTLNKLRVGGATAWETITSV